MVAKKFQNVISWGANVRRVFFKFNYSVKFFLRKLEYYYRACCCAVSSLDLTVYFALLCKVETPNVTILKDGGAVSTVSVGWEVAL